MDERDLEAEEAAVGCLVDQLRAFGGELAQRLGEVVDLVRDVVDAGPALGEELAHRCLAAQRGDELDPALADPDGGGLDALRLNGRAMLDVAAEEPLVGPHGLVEVLDRHSDVVDPQGLHAAEDSHLSAARDRPLNPSNTVLLSGGAAPPSRAESK